MSDDRPAVLCNQEPTQYVSDEIVMALRKLWGYGHTPAPDVTPEASERDNTTGTKE